LMNDTHEDKLNIQTDTVEGAGDLTTIEEVQEISHCGRKSRIEMPSQDPTVTPGAQTMAGYLQQLAIALKQKTPIRSPESLPEPHTNNISPDLVEKPIFATASRPSWQNHVPPDGDRKSSIESITGPSWRKSLLQDFGQKTSFDRNLRENWETFSSSSSPSKSLRQLSPATQDIFDITRASTSYYSGISDPIKPSTTSSTTSPQHFAEITRHPSSLYSDILPQAFSSSRQPSSTRQLSYSSSLCERPISRQVSSGRTISLGRKRKISETVFRHVSNHPSIVEQQDVEKDRSVPEIESWKWDFRAENAGTGECDIVGGKSVKERVRELDMAIDSAMSFDTSPAKKGGGLFGKWR
jgi:hypothetical protein